MKASLLKVDFAPGGGGESIPHNIKTAIETEL